jgi:hypothetical protein
MIRPIDGAILQVSVPALVVGEVWAIAGETNAAANPISAVAIRCFNITGFPDLFDVDLPAPSR